MDRLPHDTLVVLVTCSMDETRRDLAIAVMENLAEKIPEANLSHDFVVFDNASKYKDHLAFIPPGTKLVQSPVNTGYWSAINWVLQNAGKLAGRSYKYIYLIESDLHHEDLISLGQCEMFLDDQPDISCVRTQEFSVRHRWRYDKALKFLPFHVVRSEINLRNSASGEKAWFEPTNFPHIFRSNLHAKLPALNRFSSMIKVFDALSGREDFIEGDFFAEMIKLHPYIGVYDGGLFHSIYSRAQGRSVVSGSYSNDERLSLLNYQSTRRSQIVDIPDHIEVSVS